MTEPGRCPTRLNQLVIGLYRSLLQYVGEAWPWVDTAAEEEREKVLKLAARQRRLTEKLIELLIDRGWLVELGTYPTEYTDLHYVALSFLLKQLVASEQGLVLDLERGLRECGDDAEVTRHLERLLAEQKHIVEELVALARSHAAPNAVSKA